MQKVSTKQDNSKKAELVLDHTGKKYTTSQTWGSGLKYLPNGSPHMLIHIAIVISGGLTLESKCSIPLQESVIKKKKKIYANAFSFTHYAVDLSQFWCIHPENQLKIR